LQLLLDRLDVVDEVDVVVFLIRLWDARTTTRLEVEIQARQGSLFDDGSDAGCCFEQVLMILCQILFLVAIYPAVNGFKE
jgi:hypothetical protein